MRTKEKTPNPSWFKKGNKVIFTPEQRAKMGHADEKNPRWKGDKVGYSQLHRWVRKVKPMPKECQRCGEVKKLQLSNNGNYTRDVSDWEYICASCHVRKDGTIFNLKNSRKVGTRALESLGAVEELGFETLPPILVINGVTYTRHE